MTYRPSDLGLILSYKCQCACAHCIYACSPSWQEWMTPEAVGEALMAARVWGGRLQVHITGGEPFLNFPLLLHAVRAAAALGIPCYVETNAGWCVREDLAEKRFAALKEAGLGAVLISCSPFHAERIPPARTLLAIRTASVIFGPQRVMVYLSHWLKELTRFGMDESIPLTRYVETYGAAGAGRLFWEGYGLISGGRAGYRLGHLASRRPASAFAGLTCRADLLHAHHSHFDLYGNFISGFCGGLTVGSWHDLPRLLDEARQGRFPPLVEILIERGPYGLMEFAAREYGYLPLEEGYAGKCHLCVDVRRHLVTQADFPELAPRRFYDEVVAKA